MKTITELLLSLPNAIIYKNKFFQLQLFSNGTDDLRIGYYLLGDEEWKHPEYKWTCSYLIHLENIYSDKIMRKAINRLKTEIKRYKIKQ